MTTDPAVRPHAHFGDDYSPDRCAWTGLDGTKCDVPLRQSATTTDPAVTAAAEALAPHVENVRAISAFVLALAAVAAARPIIEAEERERIAADIEAEARQVLTDDGAGQVERAALLDAARIARGQSPAEDPDQDRLDLARYENRF